MQKINYLTTYDKYLALRKYMARMTLIDLTYTKEMISFDQLDNSHGELKITTEDYLHSHKTAQINWQSDGTHPQQQFTSIDPDLLPYFYKIKTAPYPGTALLTPLTTIWQLQTGLPQLYQRYEKMTCQEPKSTDELTLIATTIETIHDPVELNSLKNHRVMVELKTTGSTFPTFINYFKKITTEAGVSLD